VSVGPLYTTGSAGVDPAALPRAGAMLAVMLRNRPDVGEELRKAGALTAVFARNETVCDLPYFADLPDRAKCREPGGLGGTRRRPATACSERNIMGSSDDHFGRGTRSNGENVCVHELAHTIMNVGLSQEERNQIERRYHVAGLTNLWTGDYALRDADEFFAEMSQSYFCANPASPGHVHTHVANCAAALAAYDPESYALVENIYRGAADLR
jgi:hypothetical protein